MTYGAVVVDLVPLVVNGVERPRPADIHARYLHFLGELEIDLGGGAGHLLLAQHLVERLRVARLRRHQQQVDAAHVDGSLGLGRERPVLLDRFEEGHQCQRCAGGAAGGVRSSEVRCAHLVRKGQKVLRPQRTRMSRHVLVRVCRSDAANAEQHSLHSPAVRTLQSRSTLQFPEREQGMCDAVRKKWATPNSRTFGGRTTGLMR